MPYVCYVCIYYTFIIYINTYNVSNCIETAAE